MRPPRVRFTIARVMMVVALVALNFALLRWPVCAVGAALSALPAVVAGPAPRHWVRFYGASALVGVALWVAGLDEMTRGMLLAVGVVLGVPLLVYFGFLAWLAKVTLDDHKRRKARNG